MTPLTAAVRTRLADTNFWHIATINEDGSPQVSPVWADVDGDHVPVTTATGRRKDRNVRRDPRVALSAADKDNPYLNIEIRGRVVRIIEGQEAEDSIDELCRKYTGEVPYPWRKPGDRRVLYVIDPETAQAPL